MSALIPPFNSRAGVVRGPLLNPQPGGDVAFLPDAALAANEAGRLVFVGPYADLPDTLSSLPVTRAEGVIAPPFLDLHTHIPQHPLKGRFIEGIEGNPPEGRLIAGLNRNVFPEEGRDADAAYAARVARAFRADTLSHGVVGGAAYMTVHPQAVRAALSLLPEEWHVGLVLMDQNCPTYLRTDAPNLVHDLTGLAAEFGKRVIVTDRFAVACSTPLRRQASALAREGGLRTQTHVNEQRAEKALVEQSLYPGYASYTEVYCRDGLLDAPGALLAHCIQMTPDEWAIAADTGSVVVHCPTSNTLLGSGVMPLDALPEFVPYAICTDVGASPTCSLLAEMAQFLTVHRGRSDRATPEEALYRVTLGPAQILEVSDRLGTFVSGMPLSYVDLALPAGTPVPSTAREAILSVLALPEGEPEIRTALDSLAAEGLPYGVALDLLTTEVHAQAARLDRAVLRVVLEGETQFVQGTAP